MAKIKRKRPDRSKPREGRKWHEMEKIISDTPPLVSIKDLENKVYLQVDDKKMVINNGFVSWVELLLSLPMLLVIGYFFCQTIHFQLHASEFYLSLYNNDRNITAEDKKNSLYSTHTYGIFYNSMKSDGVEKATEKLLSDKIPDFIILLIILIIPTYWTFNSFKNFRSRYVLSREQGTLSYTTPFGFTEKTIPFSEVYFYSAPNSMYALDKSRNLSFHSVPRGWRAYRMNYCKDLSEVYSYLSLYVWYMDSNRPLPPGTVLDPYRQQDYERRKAEGLQAPLYYRKVCITTPEWDGTPSPERTE